MSFNLNYSTSPPPPPPYQIIAGGYAAKPQPDPKRTGYIFGGWYHESSCTNQVNFSSYPITSNKTFYAKWVQPPVISGSTTICSGTQYSFSASNWQTGVYKWDRSTNLSWGTKNDITQTPIDVKANGSGAGYVRILDSSGTEVKSFPVWVGPPTVTGISGPSTAKAGGPIPFSVSQTGGTSSTWTAGGNYNVWTYGINDCDIEFYSNGSWNVKANVTNQCGSVASANHTIKIMGGGNGSGTCPFCNGVGCPKCVPLWSPPYPNPAGTTINIDMDTQAQTIKEARGIKTDLTYDFRLYDMQGNLVLQTTAKSGSVQINVENLPAGAYFLHIYDGVSEKPEIKQVKIER